MTAYRNDADAREYLVTHLEIENKQLVDELAAVKAENTRLKLIAKELVLQPNEQTMRIELDRLTIQLKLSLESLSYLRRSMFFLLVLMAGVAIAIRHL
jgi:hypothetical protein